MQTRGSQKIETLKESGCYTLVEKRYPRGIVVLNHVTGKQELWLANFHFAGYVLKVGRWLYEFCTEL